MSNSSLLVTKFLKCTMIFLFSRLGITHCSNSFDRLCHFHNDLTNLNISVSTCLFQFSFSKLSLYLWCNVTKSSSCLCRLFRPHGLETFIKTDKYKIMWAKIIILKLPLFWKKVMIKYEVYLFSNEFNYKGFNLKNSRLW